MSNSPELETLENCTSQLETALKLLDRTLVHLLREKGFITDEVRDEILDSRSMLTKTEKAGELVKLMKDKVKIDPSLFIILLQCFKQISVVYDCIVKILEDEYNKVSRAPSTSSQANQLEDTGELNQGPMQTIFFTSLRYLYYVNQGPMFFTSLRYIYVDNTSTSHNTI